MCQLARFTALAVAIGVVTGCGGDRPPAYANVSGTVSYNGQPLPKGQITFSTDGRPPTMMDIADGKFAGQAMVGSNKIMISAFRKSNKERYIPETAKKQYQAYQAMNKGGGGGGTTEVFDPTMEDYIPDEWGRGSKHFRVVEAGAPNNFQFDIKGK
jgi:hypothetical protein